MTWVFVGVGAAVGAGAGAAIGSKKGGDDVWKGAVIGGALGAGGGYLAAPAAAAAPTVGTAGLGAVEGTAAFGSTGAATVGEVGGAANLGAGAGLGTTGGTGGAGVLSSGQLAGGAAGSSAFGSAGVPAGSSVMAGSGVTPAGYLGAGTGGAAVTGGTGAGGATAGGATAAGAKAAAPAAGGLSSLEKLGIAGALVAPALMPSSGTTTTQEKNPMGLASLSPNFKGYEPDRPDPYYKEKYKDYRTYAEGGIVGLAAGGDPMAPMQNTVYPQSQQDHTQFATSPQMPNSMKMAMASDYDTRTNPQNGEESPIGLAAGGVARYDGGGIGLIRSLQPGGEMGGAAADMYGVVDKNAPWLTSIQPGGAMGAMQPGRMDWEEKKRREQEAAIHAHASGGIASYAPGGHLPSSASIPNTGIYRDTDANTATKDAYEAALYRLQKANKMAGIKTAMPKAAMTKLGNVDADVAEAASGGIAHYNLGGYSDGGRMLKGLGDGMSDSIPASIGGKQPARLADGEFVVPADVVSHLGNGSTDAGAKKLYGMMDKVRQARTGNKKQGKQIKADKYLPK